MRVEATFAAVRRAGRGSVGLVPTMGYLHEGHLSLLARARAGCDTVMMSVFVNPLQFEDEEDLARYPRDVERDAALAEEEGVDVLFVPPLEEMYPEPPSTRVVVSGVSERMEGRHRPGHFEGVATVVAKLFAGLQPDLAFFGRKDAQQLAVVRRMAFDLGFPVEVVGCPTVRERDGLALSSRNVLVSNRERALQLSRGLRSAIRAVEGGERDGGVLEGLVREAAEGVELDYVELAATDSVERIPTLDRPAFLAVAGWVDGVRLIDNVAFEVGEGGQVVPDPGVTLAGESILYRRSTS